MIIDAHTHIFPDAVAEKAVKTVISNTTGWLVAYTDGTYGGLLDSMDRAGIDLSIVLPIATTPKQGVGILEWIKELTPRSDRFIFFGSVHPYDPDFRDVIAQVKELGLKGIKLHPAYQGFPADAREAYQVYEEAVKQDLVIHFHSGVDLSLPESDYVAVERFSRLVHDFAGSKMVLAHAGGIGECEKVLELMGDCGCYFDVSFVLEDLKEDEHGKELYQRNQDRFLFGTDSPWRDQQKYVTLIRESTYLNNEQKEKILYRNVLRLLGLDAQSLPGAGRSPAGHEGSSRGANMP